MNSKILLIKSTLSSSAEITTVSRLADAGGVLVDGDTVFSGQLVVVVIRQALREVGYARAVG
jgi:hypothetical protein